MTTPILQLKSLGIDDLMKFEWVTAPPAEIVLRALEGLLAAGMIGEDGRLTVIGEQVAECPVEVGVARMVSGLFFLTLTIGQILPQAIQFQRT
jgi:ATP-dependent RNA helicase DDX35